eukprot:TRINITY_DN5144_c0_g1_i6.p1 TRINITY_DN5144_c0_g1~~TRINITY_DN5144_c0_g1_i6.p1  ORF type:complete len:147 (+),score=31.10 TRINITY_DN5144_c0_g1_i6:60-443(+)
MCIRDRSCMVPSKKTYQAIFIQSFSCENFFPKCGSSETTRDDQIKQGIRGKINRDWEDVSDTLSTVPCITRLTLNFNEVENLNQIGSEAVSRLLSAFRYLSHFTLRVRGVQIFMIGASNFFAMVWTF